MRVTNAQLAELDDIIESIELTLSLFERVRTADNVYYKYKDDFFIYIIVKTNHNVYRNYIKFVGNKEQVSFDYNWEQSKEVFKNWTTGIKGEIEAEKKLNLRTNPINKKDFSQMVKKISPRFDEIYNQSYCAEQLGLDEICGFGYRKAFEILIKDYLIRSQPKEKTAEIKEMQIADCIKEYVTDDHIKLLSKRIFWLGNDHAHYLAKWKNKSVEDLKKLIDLAISWIDVHEEPIQINRKIGKVERQMPDKKRTAKNTSTAKK